MKSFSIFPMVIALKQTNLTELIRINFINTFTQFLDKTLAIRRAISSVWILMIYDYAELDLGLSDLFEFYRI